MTLASLIGLVDAMESRRRTSARAAGGGQEQQAQGAAALALPPEPTGERQRGAVAPRVPRDGEASQRRYQPCPRCSGMIFFS
jgi:hypothetical protein